MELTEHGIYLIKDEYFDTFGSPGMMWNKGENRPHYLAIRDASGLIWMIPMSTKTVKYRAKINEVEEKRGKGNCLYYHIGVIARKERAFIISGMFPVMPAYISHPFTINEIPYIVQDKKLIQQLTSKMRRYLRLLEQGQLRDQNNVLKIRDCLLTILLSETEEETPSAEDEESRRTK